MGQAGSSGLSLESPQPQPPNTLSGEPGPEHNIPRPDITNSEGETGPGLVDEWLWHGASGLEDDGE